MFGSRAETWGQRKRPRNEQPDSIAMPLVTVAERADIRTVEACLGGGGGGTRNRRRRSKTASVSGAQLPELKRVRSKRSKLKGPLSLCLADRMQDSGGKKSPAGGSSKSVRRHHAQPMKCQAVTSLETLNASAWTGLGHAAPEMLLVECNGLAGVLKTTAPTRVWWKGSTKADGTADVFCSSTSKFETIAGCASSKKWHTSLKTWVAGARRDVGLLPGVLNAGRLTQQLGRAACTLSCGCSQAQPAQPL
jgi:hypothetical protein